MSRGEGRERRSLRQVLAGPRARRVLGILGWVLTGLSAVFLAGLALVVLAQPADRRFTRPEEWLTIGLLALIPLVIVILGVWRLLRRRRRGPRKDA